MTMVRFNCLKRTRMAKHEVLERVMNQKISDGKWVGLGDDEGRKHTLKQALQVIKECRTRFKLGNFVLECNEDILHYFPEFQIGYDYTKKLHYVEINTLNENNG